MTVLAAGSVLGLMEAIGFTNVAPMIKGDIDPKTVTQLREILQFINDNQGNLIVHDDHNGGGETRELSAVVILASGKICESFTTKNHHLNALYINHENNTLHLSTVSVGDNMESTQNSEFYPSAIRRYNIEMLGKPRHKSIVAYKTFN